MTNYILATIGFLGGLLAAALSFTANIVTGEHMNEFEGDIVDAGTYQAIRIYEVVGENEYEQNEDRYDSGHELVWVDASRGIATMKERVSGYEWEMRLDDLRQIILEAGYSVDDWHEALNYVSNDDV